MDLTGKTVVVTGANSGIGLETSKALAAAGGHIVMACRDPQRGGVALQAVEAHLAAGAAELATPGTRGADLAGSAEVRELDLASFASIDAFADALPGSVHVLVNNAGVYRRRRSETANGLEATFGTNHVGHFLLTERLVPHMPAGGRVVVVSSRAHAHGRIYLHDLQRQQRLYIGWQAYADSKLANVLFARELARRHPRILANSLHPGVSMTGIFREAPSWIRVLGRPLTDSAAAIAATQIKLAGSPAVAGMTGLFWREEAPTDPAPRAQDDDMARRLWEATEALVEAYEA